MTSTPTTRFTSPGVGIGIERFGHVQGYAGPVGIVTNQPLLGLVRWTHSEEIVGELTDTFAGLILVGPHSLAAVAGAALKGVPIVRLGFTTPLEQVDSVCGTDHESGQAIGKYLTSLGHRSIAFVFGRPIYRGRHDRYCGIREVVEQTDGAELTLMQFEEESGFADALQQVKNKGASPTAFFAAMTAWH